MSKKRKKDGKPVKRSQPTIEGTEHAVHLEEKPSHAFAQAGKPTNPFVAQQTRRASQRGR